MNIGVPSRAAIRATARGDEDSPSRGHRRSRPSRSPSQRRPASRLDFSRTTSPATSSRLQQRVCRVGVRSTRCTSVPAPAPRGAVGDGRGARADGDERGRSPSWRGPAADPFVLGARSGRPARASRRGPPRCGGRARSVADGAQRLERGAHRVGVGVVGVVDDDHPVGSLGDLHPPAARRPRPPTEPATTCVERPGRTRGPRQRRRAALPTWWAPLSRSGTSAPTRRGHTRVNAALPRSSRRDVDGADVRLGRRPDVPHPGRRGPGAHRRDVGVVGVEDRQALGRNASTSSPLAWAMFSREPNSPTWATADVEDDRDVRAARSASGRRCGRSPGRPSRRRGSGSSDVTRHTVSGTPISPLSELTGATVGRRPSTAPSEEVLGRSSCRTTR